jgi:hypothetical protein
MGVTRWGFWALTHAQPMRNAAPEEKNGSLEINQD